MHWSDLSLPLPLPLPLFRGVYTQFYKTIEKFMTINISEWKSNKVFGYC